MEVKVKVQFAPYNAKQALREGRSLTLPVLKFGFWWVVSTEPWPLYGRERHLVPVLQEAGWVSEPVWMFRIILFLPSFELRTVHITCIDVLFSDILMTFPVALFMYRRVVGCVLKTNIKGRATNSLVTFNVLFRHLPRRTEDNHKISQSGQPYVKYPSKRRQKCICL